MSGERMSEKLASAPADYKPLLHPSHPDRIREDVADALRWALGAAKASNDYTSAAAIAIELNKLR